MSHEQTLLGSLPEQDAERIGAQLADFIPYVNSGDLGIVGSAAVAYHAKVHGIDYDAKVTETYERLGVKRHTSTGISDLDTVTTSLHSIDPGVHRDFWWTHWHPALEVESGVRPRHYGALVHKYTRGLNPRPDIDIFTRHNELDEFTEVPLGTDPGQSILLADAAGQLAATIGEMWRVSYNRPSNSQAPAPINPKQFGHVVVLREIADGPKVESRWRARHPGVNESAFETLTAIEQGVKDGYLTLRPDRIGVVSLAKSLLGGCPEKRCHYGYVYPVTSTLGIACRKVLNYVQ